MGKKDRLIAYIDIMGFAELVKNDNKSNIRGIYEELNSFIGKLISVKETTKTNAGEYNRALPKSVREQEDVMEVLKISVFSDSILISLKLANETEESAQEFVKELRFIFAIAQTIQYLLLKQGYVVRGIISHGEIVHERMEHLDVFYGQKFIDMHEKKIILNGQ
jgi:hypothetical protein